MLIKFHYLRPERAQFLNAESFFTREKRMRVEKVRALMKVSRFVGKLSMTALSIHWQSFWKGWKLNIRLFLAPHTTVAQGRRRRLSRANKAPHYRWASERARSLERKRRFFSTLAPACLPIRRRLSVCVFHSLSRRADYWHQAARNIELHAIDSRQGGKRREEQTKSR